MSSVFCHMNTSVHKKTAVICCAFSTDLYSPHGPVHSPVHSPESRLTAADSALQAVSA